jgi:hypothetical protein
MEKLIIFRLFLCFPFLGLFLPDMAVWLSKVPGPVQWGRVTIEATLVVLIAICSVRLAVLKKKDNNIPDAEKSSAY